MALNTVIEKGNVRTVSHSRRCVDGGWSARPLIHDGWSWDGENDHDPRPRSGNWKTDLKVWGVRCGP